MVRLNQVVLGYVLPVNFMRAAEGNGAKAAGALVCTIAACWAAKDTEDGFEVVAGGGVD
jgi:hypothetical protein